LYGLAKGQKQRLTAEILFMKHFRMPLYTKNKTWTAGKVYSFNRAIFGNGIDSRSRREVADSLSM